MGNILGCHYYWRSWSSPVADASDFGHHADYSVGVPSSGLCMFSYISALLVSAADVDYMHLGGQQDAFNML